MTLNRRMFMSSARITASLGLFFLCTVVFSSFLSAEPLLDEEPLVTNEPLLGEEAHLDEEYLITDETSIDDEPLLAEEDPFDDDFFFPDDSFFFEAPVLVFEAPHFSGIRSFEEVFPGFSPLQRRVIMSKTGLRNSFDKDSSPMLIPAPDSGINLLNYVMTKKPSHIVEALVVVPYNERELDMVDVYNALGRIKNIKDHTISSNGNNISIFVDTTRLESAQNRKPVSDPSPAATLPYSETMYLRFVDQYIGDFYLRGDVSVGLYGITYSITNFRDVSYSIFRIMKAERFSVVMYLEPIKEGVLIYSVSGIYLPGFIASRVNLTPNMNRRITGLIDWITEGLREQEKVRQSILFYPQPQK
jgi:hypothetical protein